FQHLQHDDNPTQRACRTSTHPMPDQEESTDQATALPVQQRLLKAQKTANEAAAAALKTAAAAEGCVLPVTPPLPAS
ncbi:hypothetical protein, partial [Streptomyces sp. H27-H5]|uniref:hypothetical protein n=1 Tax=Streptomyces sp. H27-H5 TaxID=2996460 RepID=UPI0022711D5D